MTDTTTSPSWIHRLVFLGVLLALFALAALALATVAEEPTEPNTEEPGTLEEPTEEPDATGAQVRNDFFQAVNGDVEAMQRALAALEAKLAENPDHPEALVYHGSLQMARSGALFESGDQEGGMALWA